MTAGKDSLNVDLAIENCLEGQLLKKQTRI